ncbi:MAG TPA: hypothetical protein VFN38_17000, partial [Gemmatimonadaceae bacterium]|nr:hypothetical protein [Gemmatimonadaceae bacterium]
RSTAAVAALVTLVGGPAGAQQATGSWQPWIGCWSAGPAIGGIAPSAMAPLVCIAPTPDANVAEVTTISGDKVVSTQRIDAGGRELPVDTKGCTGTQRAQWSADGRRVYLRAVTTCDGLERVTSGIMAISPTGEWLDVQGVGVAGEEGVRVAHYRDAGLPSAVPEPIAAALRARGAATPTARLTAGGTIGSAAVIEASRSAAPAVVEAWLLERGQHFAVDAKELVRLADAGVPPRVTDALVALSNPEHFAVARPDDRSRNRRARMDDDDIAGRRIYVYMDPIYSPYRWGYAPYGYGYGYGYGPYGYSPLGYGGYGYGSGYSGYPGYVAPIVIVNPQTPVQRGQMVKGRGYTPSDASGSTTTPTATPRASSTSSGASSSGSSSSQPSSSSPPASEPRTAHPKP